MRVLRVVKATLLGLALLCLSSGAAAENIEIKVECFKGGYGIDFFEQCAREYEQAHPGVKINLTGHPRIWEKLLPAFTAGTPPDLIWPGWGMNTWQLVFGGQILCMDDLLQKPAIGTDKKWIDTFIPSLLAKGKYQGKYYMMPYNFDAFGWWYNKRMFDQHGWTAPKTYDELLVLCEKIKKEHIAPVTFTGRYPTYLLKGTCYPWAISAGGLEVFKQASNLEPGAWKNPAFLRSAKAIMEMKHRGNFQPGCIGMNHTESQMEFLVGRAAMIPCGTWLHSEMRKLLPKDFVMEFMLPPVFADGKGDPTLVCAGVDGKGWCIPVKGHHHEVAADFFRYLTSPAVAKRFVETKGTMMAVRGLEDAKIPPQLKEPLRLVNAANGTWNSEFGDWYPQMGTDHENAMRDLYNEVITPEEFVERLEESATQVREDPNITKFKME